MPIQDSIVEIGDELHGAFHKHGAMTTFTQPTKLNNIINKYSCTYACIIPGVSCTL